MVRLERGISNMSEAELSTKEYKSNSEILVEKTIEHYLDNIHRHEDIDPNLQNFEGIGDLLEHFHKKSPGKTSIEGSSNGKNLLFRYAKDVHGNVLLLSSFSENEESNASLYYKNKEEDEYKKISEDFNASFGFITESSKMDFPEPKKQIINDNLEPFKHVEPDPMAWLDSKHLK